MASDPPDDRPEAWLVSDEAHRILRERGLSLAVELRDARGATPSDSELKQLRDELTVYQARCCHAQKLATIGNMAAGVNHEARNLLTGILGFAQVLLTKLNESEPGHDMLRAIERESRRCVELLSSYLQLSRAASEVPTPLRISEIVLPVEQLMAYPLQQRGCSLQVMMDSDLALILGHQAELQRVLLNLVRNAADACVNAGHIELKVRNLAHAQVEISLTDNGPGVPAALRAKIFAPFFSTKPANSGTGLGLALSRNIVEAHGGQLELDASHQPGARFVIRLPAASIATAEDGD